MARTPTTLGMAQGEKNNQNRAEEANFRSDPTKCLKYTEIIELANKNTYKKISEMGVTHLPQLMIGVDGVKSGGGQQKEIAAILLLLVVTENHAKLDRETSSFINLLK